MRKTLRIILLAVLPFLLCRCEEEHEKEPVTDIQVIKGHPTHIRSIEKFIFEGHQYILFEVGIGDQARIGIVEDPNSMYPAEGYGYATADEEYGLQDK